MAEFSEEYTIYAVKVLQPWEEGSDYWIPRICEELKAGRARLAWGYYDGADIRKIKKKSGERGWDSLSKEELTTWQHVWFVLGVKPGDYFVYINMPEYGKCTIVTITGGYDFSAVWDPEEQGEFRHCLPCEFKATFDRNADIVHPFLRQRLGLQRAWYRVYAKPEFRELLDAINRGLEGKPPEKRLEEAINKHLMQIAHETYRNFPGKSLEDLVCKILRQAPNVKGVQKGPDVNGADLEVEFETDLGVGGLQSVELCAVQVKSYVGAMGYTKAIEDIRRAFESDRGYTCGLIVSTALEMTEDFERQLQELRAESNKDVGILIGKDLAYLLMKYGIDRKAIA